jgi:hypothetical protein
MGILAFLIGAAVGQIGYLWTFDELTAKADFVVIAEPVRTEDTGVRTVHPGLQPDLPVAELRTTLKILSILKPDTRDKSAPAEIGLRHYRIDVDELRRTHRQPPGAPPPGLMNAGSSLDFAGPPQPYLLFLKRIADGGYEPLSGHTFPTDSVYRLLKKQ